MNFFKYYSASPDGKLSDVMAPLRYHSIRYSSPELFNDPYDCKCLFEKLDGEKEDVFSEVINRCLRVACMSRNSQSPIMWSHYASNHMGYVVEYKINENNYKKVEYKEIKPFYYSSKDLKKAVLQKHPNASESEIVYLMKQILLSDDNYMMRMMNAIFTKHLDWSYEEEFRFIDVDEKGFSNTYVDKLLDVTQVNSIILGYRFDHEKYGSELKSIIQNVFSGRLTIYKAMPSFDEYRMKIWPYVL